MGAMALRRRKKKKKKKGSGGRNVKCDEIYESVRTGGRIRLWEGSGYSACIWFSQSRRDTVVTQFRDCNPILFFLDLENSFLIK